MAAKQNFLGLVNAGGEIVRAPLVGVELLHQRPMGARDGLGARTRLHAKDLIGLLFSHFSTGRGSAPRVRVSLRVFTPAGIPAVKIRHQ